MVQMIKQHPERYELMAWREGDLDREARRSIEEHVKTCEECRDFVEYVEWFYNAFKGTLDRFRLPEEKCPPSDVLTGYLLGELDEETARHVRAHLFVCDECFEVVQLWSQDEEREQKIIPFPAALAAYREKFSSTRQMALAAQPTGAPKVGGLAVDRIHGTREQMELEVLFGPELTPEGRLRLTLGLPQEERFRGKPAEVILLMEGQTYHLHNTTQNLVIQVDHPFEPVEQVGADQERFKQALQKAIAVTVQL